MYKLFNIGQPTIALPQSIVMQGDYPNLNGAGGWDTPASIGFMVTTAFEYGDSAIKELSVAHGQKLAISDHSAVFSLLGYTYGGYGDGMRNHFNLPDLQGRGLTYKTDAGGSTVWGKTQGTPTNSAVLEQDQLPTTLGGVMSPVHNEQYALGMQYVIQVEGLFPSGGGPEHGTIGMVYPFASASGGVPQGFLPADGRLLDISQHQALYAILGTAYGGNGTTTFALPDLRDRLPVGAGVSEGYVVRVGQMFGVDEISLLEPNVSKSDSEPVSVMQPSLGVHYVISMQGTYKAVDKYDPMLGQIAIYAGERVPDGWTLADGQVLPISENTALFSLIGNTFGGNGTTTFALPDLRGRTVVGTGGEQDLSLGQTQGSFTEQVTMANLPEIVVPPPGVHLTDDSGHSVTGTVTSGLELDISGVWPQARVQYSTDGTTWSETYTPQEGNNTLLVRQVNVLGQASQPTNPINFVLDTSAPEAPQVTIDGVSTAAPMATPAFKATVPADGDDTIPRTATGKLLFGHVEDGAQLEFSIDGGQTWGDTFEAQAGLNAVQVRQVDVAGNISPASEVIRFHWDGSDTEAAVTTTSSHSNGGNVITVEQHGALVTGLGAAGIDLLIHGHQQDIALPADIEHVRLTENGLNNEVTGNAQDNVFEVVVGNWVIDGQLGTDTVQLANPIVDYVLTQESHEGQLQATLYGPEGRIIVRDIETIEFSDATLLKTDGTDIAQIDHLYEEVLGRMPDPEGLTYWVNQMSKGSSLTDVAQALSQSTEFKQLYGTPSQEQLVEELYEAILNRAPDAKGLAHWAEALVVHEVTEGELIVSLLMSAESQSASTTQVSGDGLFLVG